MLITITFCVVEQGISSSAFFKRKKKVSVVKYMQIAVQPFKFFNLPTYCKKKKTINQFPTEKRIKKNRPVYVREINKTSSSTYS